jgi:UDP-N-acetylglucosamine 2-epimerase (non-hydrolysing)
VVGDVNSSLACSVVAKKLLIDVAHVEAGLRSFDMTMPEEINRLVTDSISDYFFVTEESGVANLLHEGRLEDRIHFVGNVMVDNLFYQLRQLEEKDDTEFSTCDLKRSDNNYIFLTLHRPSNVDSRESFGSIASALNRIAEEKAILFPVHPRTEKMIDKFNIRLSKDVVQLPPLGFGESLFLWKDAALVMTDSGGLQEETTALGVPCITLRENTERPITIEMGTNVLAGNKKESIIAAYRASCKKRKKEFSVPPKWDGRAAERILKILSVAGR